MAIVEVRCPRCGSPSSPRNRKKHEYQCDHCGATFIFVDTTKKEVVHDRRAHNCPICGRPVEAGEGYVCRECGKRDLCENCVEKVGKKFLCRECLEEKGWNCPCGKRGVYECVVCGVRRCKRHAFDFDIEGEWEGFRFFSLWCPNCGGEVCSSCAVEKRSFWGGKTYYCKKCGSKLERNPPIARIHVRM